MDRKIEIPRSAEYRAHAQVPMCEVLVLNASPKGLQSYIVKQPERLLPEDIALVKSHLSMFIRKSRQS